jgi:hypothetical protein
MKSRRRSAALSLVIVVLVSVPATVEAAAWTTGLAALPVGLDGHAATAFGREIYVVGGVQNGSPPQPRNNWFYGVDSGSWDSTSATSVPSDRYDMGSAFYCGRIYFFGGVEHGGPLPKVEYYEPRSNTWQGVASMPQASTGPTATIIGSRIFVGGGTSPGFGDISGSDKLQVYDPVNDSWVIKASMPTKRDNVAAAAWGGKLYVFGGRSNSTTHNVVEAYDPETDMWETSLSQMPTATMRAGAATVGGKIYVIGGQNSSGTLDIVQVYEPMADTWTFDDSMPTARFDIPRTLPVVDGGIYVMGGWGASGRTDVVEVFRPTQRNGVEEKIYFASNSEGEFRLFRMNPDASNIEQVTFDEGFHDNTPRVSPDGNWIAFNRQKLPGADQQEIWVMPSAPGSDPVQITDAPGFGEDSYNSNSPTWSPRGDFLAIQRTRPLASGGNLPGRTWIINIQGTTKIGEEKEILTRETHWGDWSPDGSNIALGCKVGGNLNPFEICRLFLSPQLEETVIPWVRGEYQPKYSPDGTELMWLTFRLSQNGHVFIADKNGGSPRNITALEQSPAPGWSMASWSLDGKTIILRDQTNFDLWTIEADGSEAPVRLLTNPDVLFREPHWALVPVQSDENEPPTACAGDDAVVACALPDGTEVPLDGTCSSDPENQLLTYTWTGSFGTASGPEPTVFLEPGVHPITLTVDDGNGGSDSDEVVVTVVVDSAPPVITLNGPTEDTVECVLGAYTELGATASDDCDEDVPVVIEGIVDVMNPDDYVIRYNATDDSGNQAVEVIRTVHVVDTTVPVITLNGAPEVTVACVVGSYIELGATAVDACDPAVSVVIDGSVNVSETGDYVIRYNATDGSGNEAAKVMRTVHVVDTTGPNIVFDLTTTSLWPPNHKMHVVATGISASDLCDTQLALQAGDVSVTSNEPINGQGDGNTDFDWEVIDNGDDSFDLLLRAERDGSKTGRIYTITVEVTDASMNTATAAGTVTVGHDKGKGASKPASFAAEDLSFGVDNYPNPFNPTTAIRYPLYAPDCH